MSIPLPPSRDSFANSFGDDRISAADVPLPPSNATFSERGTGKQNPQSVAEAWENLMRAVNKHDDEKVQNWKEDIDTLLVFAGLFSAVVTAFVIESYQWLDEDPADTTVALLTQISKQLGNPSMPFEDLSSSPFHASSLSIRVNTFWFLSLILSLASGLFALLGKQWLREHRRDIPTSSPGEALGLRQMRDRSLEIWGVPSFLAALPILLELALLLFFAGVVDLLWSLHRVPFIVVSIAVGVSVGLYSITTMLPVLTVLWGEIGDPRRRDSYDFDRIRAPSLRFVCPYKSPQARAAYALTAKLFYTLSIPKWLHKYTKHHKYVRLPRWQSLDLDIVKRFDRNPAVFLKFEEGTLKVYELAGLSWAYHTFRDNPALISCLETILETVPPSTTMSAVFQRWPWFMWTHVSSTEIRRVLKPVSVFSLLWEDYTSPSQYIDSSPWLTLPDILNSTPGIEFLYYQAWWKELVETHDMFTLLKSLSRFSKAHPERVFGVRFWFPFPLAERLWTNQDPFVRGQGIRLVRVYTKSWNAYPGVEEERDERMAFILVLAEHINRTEGIPSEILRRKRGHAFLHHIHNQIILHGLYRSHPVLDIPERRSNLMKEWRQAMQKAKEIGNLPEDYFAPIPETPNTEPEDNFPLSLVRSSSPALTEDTAVVEWRNTPDLPHLADSVGANSDPLDEAKPPIPPDEDDAEPRPIKDVHPTTSEHLQTPNHDPKDHVATIDDRLSGHQNSRAQSGVGIPESRTQTEKL
ncbi:hypothetical protein VNI00_000418 [Paramarasmius palmivorus]|uniref:DUF6535 domain-containing protein n=1 Tax=Paramarasmius palmivorus TaxID=297713 RepID=A0AAW0EF21_9AGAR